MTLSKLSIQIESDQGSFSSLLSENVEMLFNPNQISISKQGGNINSFGQLVGADSPANLNVDLFFDTTIKDTTRGLDPTWTDVLLLRHYTPKNVEDYTKKIYNLTQTNGKLGRPPLCKLEWGTQGYIFTGFLQSVTKTLTQFMEDGTPVRATLSCTFQEWESPETKKKKENPIDDPVRVVKRGETLSSISAEEYNNPALWRIIANENKLDNPRKIKPGQVLTIPPL